MSRIPVSGTGLGLRRSFISEISEINPAEVDFYEVAPENWIGVAGRYGKLFRQMTEKTPFVCHGLSLSLGGPTPLDLQFLHDLKQFFKLHTIRYYSEHLSYCSDKGHLYDLMPIPFTEEAVDYVAERVRRVQDILEQRIAIENVSYYAAPGKEMDEIEFISEILERADCDLLLDVNNIYVNSINHHYNASDFLKALPGKHIAYIHVAGHYVEAEDLLVDTHGSAVIDPVWQLLEETYQYHGIFPTLLERDFNIPPVPELLSELQIIQHLQTAKHVSESQLKYA
ncbi:MAG TPA: DUF692 domain-containing protein [Crenotrichaceae bacterium]|nr:DUF692 domain-containing protein [Crenotrichaceae bacterium]